MTQTETKQRELTITRVFDAPWKLVFKAWAEPERVMHWLGPKGFTGTEFRLDVKAGGTWHATMRGPDGNEYANGGRVLEYVEPERLSYTFAWDDSPEQEMTVTITLRDIGRKTEMTFHQAVFPSVESRDGHNGGWSESFDRLDEYLRTA